MRSIALSLIVTAALLAACSDGAPDGSRVSLTFASSSTSGVQPAAGFFASMAPPVTFDDGQNELVIEKVEIVLREIELERIEVVDCDVEPEPAGCEDFEVGPILLDLPLGGGTMKQVTIPIEAGTYDEIEFEIHKVSGDDPEDAEFRAAHPDMVDKSIRVTGTFNGQAFTYVTDLNVEQELDLVPALVIDENTVTTNVTILVNLDAWFRDGAGALVDPASANKGEVNENLVKDNIKDSIEAFEDEDEDGIDD